MTRQCSVRGRPGLFGRTVSAQAAHPHGVLGSIIGRIWITETAAVNDRAVALLAVTTGERVLEIGCGPGRTVDALARRGARITGIDPSAVMLGQARHRNAAAVRDGRVQLFSGRAEDLPLPDASVDAALTVHTVHFWSDLAAGLRELRRVLTPAGRVVIAGRLGGSGIPRRFDPAIYRFPTASGLTDTLRSCGFDDPTIEYDPLGTALLVTRAARTAAATTGQPEVADSASADTPTPDDPTTSGDSPQPDGGLDRPRSRTCPRRQP